MFRVNDIFYSLQGEGHNTGRAAVFVRFAGCNLRCPFCDTEFDTYREMTADEIVAEISHLLPPYPRTSVPPILIVLTGGEPTLQVDEAFVDGRNAAKEAGDVAVELRKECADSKELTNGQLADNNFDCNEN